MEATNEAEGFLYSIKPPRLEDAGLEDCALPPDLIKEAFCKAASALKSVITTSDGEDESGGKCVDDPWEDSTDVVVGITDGIAAPAGSCVDHKGGGLTEAPGDEVAVAGGDPNEKGDTVVEPDLPAGGDACVDGLQGLDIEGNDRGIFGKKSDVDRDDEDGDKPTLKEGYV
ncbi:hypothetical protein F511_06013 [Dorcoceras hygrometricum]|uniref:Uncharacterized protein n=1 Tax=Dorcoceras hygrometricum TaxID=472368 RepID=A0A2Z7B3G8_9LAMI|nr:hypothetical protein F511_06013 [Dorcoceras hygrometricum]